MSNVSKLMKIAYKDKDEIYLIWMIGVSDCIQSCTNIAN